MTEERASMRKPAQLPDIPNAAVRAAITSLLQGAQPTPAVVQRLSPPILSRDLLITRISREMDCTWLEAWLLVRALSKRALHTKRWQVGRFEMLLVHPLLDRVMTDDQVAAPDSLHEACNLSLLGETRVFRHGKREQKRGRRCVIETIEVNVRGSY